MRPIRLLALLAPGLLPAAGCSSTAAGHPSAVSAAPASAAATGGAVHLTDYTDNDGPSSTVILTGAIGDFGGARRLDSGKRRLLVLTLAHGSFRLDLTDLTGRWAALLSNLPVNSATCSATASVSGAAPVVAGSGSGSYQGITGAFHLTMPLDEVYRPGACVETGAYLAQSIVITGTGAVTVRRS